jgi:hypothetical protein
VHVWQHILIKYKPYCCEEITFALGLNQAGAYGSDLKHRRQVHFR